jgi:hypothetical protein
MQLCREEPTDGYTAPREQLLTDIRSLLQQFALLHMMPDDPADIDAVLVWYVEQYQIAHAALHDERLDWWSEHYTAWLAQISERIWMILRQDLRRVARRWHNAGMGADIEDIAMTSMLELLEALPRVKLDARQNPRVYLRQIAHRALDTQYQRIYSVTPRTRSKHNRFRMIPISLLIKPYEQAESTEHERYLIDHRSTEGYEAVLEDMIRVSLHRLIKEYWQSELSVDDQELMRQRWQIEPPVPFAEIARQRGDGWTATALRQRHKRILEQTRKFLEDTWPE